MTHFRLEEARVLALSRASPLRVVQDQKYWGYRVLPSRLFPQDFSRPSGFMSLILIRMCFVSTTKPTVSTLIPAFSTFASTTFHGGSSGKTLYRLLVKPIQ